MFAVLLVLCVFIALTSDSAFMSAYNLTNVGKHTALLVLIAIGEAFVIISGGIDLSVGAIVGFSAVFTVMSSTGVLFPWLRLTIFAAIPLSIGLCALIGFIQGMKFIHNGDDENTSFKNGWGGSYGAIKNTFP